MKLSCSILFIMLFLIVKVNSQSDIKNLNINDQVPAISIPKLISKNSKTISSNTSEYKDLLLIIDFWSTGCPSCIEALPNMMQLNKQFDGQAVILPVTYERESDIRKFLLSNKYTSKSEITTVVEDSLFRQYFKHVGEPHEVWIFKGKVIGITDGEYVDENNISKVLNGERVDWPLKYDYYTFDRNIPLFDIDSGQAWKGVSQSYAAVGAYRDKLSSYNIRRAGIVRDSVKNIVRFFMINQSIFSAYAMHLLHLTADKKLIKPTAFLNPNCIIWKVAKKDLYVYDAGSGYHLDWLRTNGICFESAKKNTGQSDTDIYSENLNQLNALLGLNVRWEKRLETIYTLVKLKDKASSKGVQKLQNQNQTSGDFIYRINQEASNPYVFNGINSGVILSLNISSWTDMIKIRSELKRNGYDLLSSKKLVDKLIFEEHRNISQ